ETSMRSTWAARGIGSLVTVLNWSRSIVTLPWAGIVSRWVVYLPLIWMLTSFSSLSERLVTLTESLSTRARGWNSSLALVVDFSTTVVVRSVGVRSAVDFSTREEAVTAWSFGWL